MIANLRELAVQEGKVDAGFPLRVREAQKQIYLRLVDEIDKLLGRQPGRRNIPACPVPVTECA
jgi:hypothetical protein